MEDLVIGVDEQDNITGYHAKLEAHQKGILHRAISVFVFNSAGDWLLQRRAKGKYHSEMLWSNTACSHPFQQETVLEAAKRRLTEEMGISTELNYAFSFIYRAELDNDLIENELDHVFFGFSDQLPKINKEEVDSYRYISSDLLEFELLEKPEQFTEWFKLLHRQVKDYIKR